MITCKICGENFKTMITWKHLAKHNIKTKDYISLHGDVVSDEYRHSRSVAYSGENNPNFGKKYSWTDEQKNNIKGRTPHNKGTTVTDEAALLKIREAIALREEKYAAGIYERVGKPKTEEQKAVLSQKITEYAANNPGEMKRRAQISLQTKRDNNFDFGAIMRGKRHTEATKELLRESSRRSSLQKTLVSNENITNSINSLNLTLLSDINNTKLYLRCNTCNTQFSFTKQYFTPSKIKDSLCPTCFPRSVPKVSQKEQELYDFVKTICPDAVQSYRASYHSKELDIFIPSKNIGVEFNGLYWHCEETLLSISQSPKKDHEKYLHFKDQGIKTIQIFEDEWDNQREIVLSRVENILGVTKEKIFARKCQIKELTSKEASVFFEQNHIMGNGRSNVRYGLYYNEQLVSAMSFSKSNISRKVSEWEINRFASLIGYTVIGGASRLFTYFLKNENPEMVISYADNRWSSGDLYKTLGFELVSQGYPNYWYVPQNSIQRIHRYTLRKTKKDDQSLTEYENRRNGGYSRIWDSGSTKWIWKQK